jgi:hypothetical protein
MAEFELAWLLRLPRHLRAASRASQSTSQPIRAAKEAQAAPMRLEFLET